jgi:uncharacterized protein (UPF0264 family)
MNTTLPRTKTKLLVSVRSPEEAALALEAGADHLDVKDPSRGSLGMAHHETVAAVLELVGERVPVSAALGEWSEQALTEACWHLELPLSYVKWGLAGYGSSPGWGENLLETRRQVPGNTDVVLVAYVDHEQANSPPPLELVKFAKRYRYKAFLFDTCVKDGSSLLDYYSVEQLKEFVDALKVSKIQVALAGSLKQEQLKLLKNLGADWIAVRGAVSIGGKRDADLDPVRIKKCKASL